MNIQCMGYQLALHVSDAAVVTADGYEFRY